MSITAADLLKLAALQRPEDDETASGGGIDVDTRLDTLEELAAADTLNVASDDNGDDSQDITIVGRDASGAEVSEVISLTGTTPAEGAQSFERVLKATLDGDCAGTVTIVRATGGATVATIAPGERGVSRLFIKSSSDPSQEIVRYEKEFWKNTHGTLSLTSAEVELTADPSSRIEIGLAATVDDTVQVTDRTTAPAAISFVDDNVAQSVPGGALGPGEAIGVWVEQTLPSDDAARKSSYTTQLSGTST